MPRLVHVVTVPLTLRFLRGQLEFMEQRGFEVQVVSSPGPLLDEFREATGVPAHAVPLSRSVDPKADLKSFISLSRLFRRLRPDIVHSHTPKAGLIGMMAARATGVPVRVYHMRGLPYLTAEGTMQKVLWSTESTSCALAHRVIAVSESLAAAARSARFVGSSRIRVVGKGSSNGVDARGRFDPEHAASKAIARERFGLPADGEVVTFVGRLVRDKGIAELVAAWRVLAPAFPTATLLLVGPFEERDGLSAQVQRELQSAPRVVHIPFTEDTPTVYASSDVVVLPTYREGFPNVPLEAASMRLPVVTTDAVGARDSVEDFQTGRVVPVRDVAALEGAISAYLKDADLRESHGGAGRARVLASFRPEPIWEGFAREYEELLSA